MMGEKIKLSSFGSGPREYETKYDWGFFCQAGTSGVVFSKTGNYKTAFFEAFPRSPKCFIRGEGSTVEEAEQQAWDKWQKIQVCKHEMERRHRTDGYGYCKHCSYSSMVFEPLTKCCKCGKLTAYSSDIKKNWYCEKHRVTMPKRLQHEWMQKENKRLPRKTKKILKKGAAFRLTGNIHGNVKFTFHSIMQFRANGYMLSAFNRKQREELVRLSRTKI